MEIVLALAIGVLAGSGIWLLLRPRTFQVIMGLSLISYAVNLFIFGMGRITLGAPPVINTDWSANASQYADPLPQALVLTAIVIGFAMTAFVVVLALRGVSSLGSDHVDGRPDVRVKEEWKP
jgi:multicomponent K+:H+ antiporter subunit C